MTDLCTVLLIGTHHYGADLVEQHAYQNATYYALDKNNILENTFDLGMMSERKQYKACIQQIIKLTSKYV